MIFNYRKYIVIISKLVITYVNLLLLIKDYMCKLNMNYICKVEKYV